MAMRIDWDALLPPKPPEKVGAGDMKSPEGVTAGDAATPATDAGIAAREREGDNRRRCAECGNLSERGLCLAAYRGEIKASRSYTPMRDILRRCEAFAPLPTDPDPRHGRDKWGCLTEAVAGRAAAPNAQENPAEAAE